MQDDQDTRSGDAPPPDTQTTGSSTPPPAAPPPAAEPPPVAPAQATPPPPADSSGWSAPSTPPATTSQRPTGVTIIAVLAAIGGAFAILGGLGLLVGGSFIGAATGSAALGSLASLFGALLLVSGILNLVFAWGAWGLQSWAWTLGVVLQAVALVLGVYNLINGNSGAIVSIAVAALITYYLFRPEIRAAFGRA